MMETENKTLENQIEELKQTGHEVGSESNGLIKSTSSFKVAGSKPAPRLYCDICDVFDLHETEDCPKQSMLGDTEDELSSHSKYNAPKTTRKFCGNFKFMFAGFLI